MKHFPFFMTIALATLIISGCSETSNAPDDVNDHDVITTVTFTLRPTNGVGDTLVYVWEDIDGVGGNNPNRIDTMRLASGVIYDCSVKMENRSVSPAIDVTLSIEEEKDNHQLIHNLSAYLGSIAVVDKDSRNLPVGLRFTLQTAVDASVIPGTLQTSLYHYENAGDKVAGLPGNETDVSVSMPVFKL